MSIDLEAIRSRSALYGDPEWRGKHSLWVQVACDDAVTLLAEVDRLTLVAMDLSPYLDGQRHERARALPVIEAARALVEHHPPRDPALATFRAALAAWDASAPDGRGSEEEK